MNILSLVLSVTAFICAFVPIFGIFFAVAFSIAAVIIAYVKTNKNKNKEGEVIAVVLSIFAIIVCVIVNAIYIIDHESLLLVSLYVHFNLIKPVRFVINLTSFPDPVCRILLLFAPVLDFNTCTGILSASSPATALVISSTKIIVNAII